ncbi:39S ribosomal protein L22, mitochondrial [Oleoguttula sp. CCFEE 5521]
MNPSTPLRLLISRHKALDAATSLSHTRFPRPLPLRQRRHASSSDPPSTTSNPILEAYKRDNSNAPDLAKQQMAQAQQQMSTPGDLPASSIFEDDRRARAQQMQTTSDPASSEAPRDPANMARVLDPDPNARERWLRKKVIQMVRKGGRLSKEEFVTRTEREHLLKSENLKTSIKKLGMLARQIQGKGLEEAMVQMRFSKKKVAGEVLKVLEAARDEAVVMRGMGLGGAGNEVAAPVVKRTAMIGAETTGPLSIQLKDGSTYAVKDESKIYIDQAWVGRGPYGKLPDYRARGRVFIMRTPWTSLSVVLKEEATRVREWREREAKRLKERLNKVWVPLPDRPVQGMRGQYYSW